MIARIFKIKKLPTPIALFRSKTIVEEDLKIAKLEKIGRYCEAAREYELLGMQRKAKHCKRHAIAEASKLENARRYAQAATAYADLEMWEKAYKCLKSESTHLKK